MVLYCVMTKCVELQQIKFKTHDIVLLCVTLATVGAIIKITRQGSGRYGDLNCMPLIVINIYNQYLLLFSTRLKVIQMYLERTFKLFWNPTGSSNPFKMKLSNIWHHHNNSFIVVFIKHYGNTKMINLPRTGLLHFHYSFSWGKRKWHKRTWITYQQGFTYRCILNSLFKESLRTRTTVSVIQGQVTLGENMYLSI